MLHSHNQITISDYSKGSWGLSVLPRVSGIFTGITTSPRSTLRQCWHRYTIRAGRNLPDKEFRYLRTVIVTADIHRGFTSPLRIAADGSDWPFGIGHVSLPILPLASWQRAMFLLNSRRGLFVETVRAFTPVRHPFSLSYGAGLPSSLKWFHSRTWGYSPRPPVSVCGTDAKTSTFRSFSRQRSISESPLPEGFESHPFSDLVSGHLTPDVLRH